jgi:hypothetical protein
VPKSGSSFQCGVDVLVCLDVLCRYLCRLGPYNRAPREEERLLWDQLSRSVSLDFRRASELTPAGVYSIPLCGKSSLRKLEAHATLGRPIRFLAGIQIAPVPLGAAFFLSASSFSTTLGLFSRVIDFSQFRIASVALPMA